MSRGTMEVGVVLGGSIRAIVANAGAFLVLATIAYVPMVPMLVWTITTTRHDPSLAALGQMVEWGLATLCGWTLAAFLVRGTYEHVRGRRAGLDAMLYHGVSRLLPALGIALLQGLMFAGIFVATVVPVFCAAGLLGSAGAVFAFVAMAVALVLAFIVMCMLWVAVPAVVVERCGIRALQRSLRLTAGVRWRVFAVLFVIWLCSFASSKTVEVLTTHAHVAVAATLGLVVQVVFGAWHAVAAVVGYYELRRNREGLDLEELASVFE